MIRSQSNSGTRSDADFGPFDVLPLDAMSANPWFAGLPVAARTLLLAESTPVTLGEGQMLYRVGDPTGVFYGLLTGALKISSSARDGREAILSVLEAGNWFGEMSMVDGLPRTHDATAIGDCQLLGMPRTAFDRAMQRAEFAGSIARLLALRMRLVFGVLEDAALRTPRARAARRLMLLSHGDSTLSSAGRRMVPISQSDLAMMLGITRQTLAKELKVMQEAGALTIGYGRIGLASFDALERFASGLD